MDLRRPSMNHFDDFIGEVEDYVLQANWPTAGKIPEELRKLKRPERTTNIEARMRRNADVTDYEFATRNATAAIADGKGPS